MLTQSRTTSAPAERENCACLPGVRLRFVFAPVGSAQSLLPALPPHFLAQQQQDAEAMSQASDQAHQVGMARVQEPQGGE
jgi:hypothetical protein